MIRREGVDLNKGGEAAYRVAFTSGTGASSPSGSGRHEAVIPRDVLVSDGMGPVYAERGGLYGFYGVHYETSTRERLRYFDAHQAALDRLSRPLIRGGYRSLMGVSMGQEKLIGESARKKSPMRKSTKKKVARARSKPRRSSRLRAANS